MCCGFEGWFLFWQILVSTTRGAFWTKSGQSSIIEEAEASHLSQPWFPKVPHSFRNVLLIQGSYHIVLPFHQLQHFQPSGVIENSLDPIQTFCQRAIFPDNYICISSYCLGLMGTVFPFIHNTAFVASWNLSRLRQLYTCSDRNHSIDYIFLQV